MYISGYITNKVVVTKEKTKLYPQNACIITDDNECCLKYDQETPLDPHKLEIKGDEDSVNYIINTGSGSAILSRDNISLQDNANFILKANNNTVKAKGYVFTKGDGSKIILAAEDNNSINTDKVYIGSDPDDLATKIDDFEIGQIISRNIAVNELYFTYGQVGLVNYNDTSAILIKKCYSQTSGFIQNENSSTIIRVKSESPVIDSYTKAEADARFKLYEAKIADLERRIRELEKGQMAAEPTAEPSIDETGKVTLNNVSIVNGQIDLGSKADLSESGSVMFK